MLFPALSATLRTGLWGADARFVRSQGWGNATERLRLSLSAQSSVMSTPACSSPRTYATEQGVQKSLTINNMNPQIKIMEYAVRGPLVARAGEIEKELEKVRDFVSLL